MSRVVSPVNGKPYGLAALALADLPSSVASTVRHTATAVVATLRNPELVAPGALIVARMICWRLQGSARRVGRRTMTAPSSPRRRTRCGETI